MGTVPCVSLGSLVSPHPAGNPLLRGVLPFGGTGKGRPPRLASTPLHKVFLENGSPSPSCNSSWQRQCKWLWDNKRDLCLQGRNKNANIFGMKKQRRFTPWYFLSVLCICLYFTFSFLSFGFSKCNKALGSDGEGSRGSDGAEGWGLQPLRPRASELRCEMLFPPCRSPASEGFPLLQPGLGEGLAASCRDALPRRIQCRSVPCLTAASPSSRAFLRRCHPTYVAGV